MRTGIWRCLRSSAFCVALALVSAVAHSQHVPKSSGKPTEEIIKRYEKLVADGALLTPGGWEKAAKLFVKADPYPQDGTILLLSIGGLIGETSLEGDRATVETKWTPNYGSIDPKLRWHPAYAGNPPDPPIETMPTIFVYHLVRTKTDDGRTEWKMQDPLSGRVATLERAIQYLRMMLDKTTDPVLKKNAARSIAILKRLAPPCGTASAC